MSQHPHILKALQSELWAITPDALNQIIAIAQGFGDAEAVAAKLGRPLNNSRGVTVRDGVAIVPVIGPIFRYANLFTEISGASSVQTLATNLQTAIDDQSIKAVILEIDSPGGQVAGISEFAAQIRAADTLKPVIAYISDTGASAAYWLAAAAGKIIVADTARIGSIGVVMQATIGEEEGTVKFISSQSPLKQADPGSDQGRIQYQKTVDALAEVFIGAVAGYRATTRENVIANYGLGGMHIASDAIAAGMADQLGSLEALIQQLTAPAGSARRQYLAHSKGNSIMPNTTLTRESLAADHPELVKALLDEGFGKGIEEGKRLGAAEERVRIQAIEALATLGHDALIAQFKFDGVTQANDAALKILAAEKENRAAMAVKLAADTPAPLAPAPAAFNDGASANDPDDSDEAEAQRIIGLFKNQQRAKAS